MEIAMAPSTDTDPRCPRMRPLSARARYPFGRRTSTPEGTGLSTRPLGESRLPYLRRSLP